MGVHTSRSEPLQGHRALVTGSTTGLGLAIAQGLADADSHVMLHGLEDESAMGPRHPDEFGLRPARHSPTR